MSDDDRTFTLKLPKNPFKRNRSDDDGNNNGGKKHKRHVLLWLIVIYLVVMAWWNTMKANETLEAMWTATKMDRGTNKDVDYKLDYTPFGPLEGLLGGLSLANVLIIALIIVIIFLARAVMKNNKKDEENHS